MQNCILPVILCVTLSSVHAILYVFFFSLENSNSVKFTSSREDNSTTNDSLVVKIAHAQLHMYTNIVYKLQISSCKTVGEKLRTKLCPQTNGRTDSHGDSSIPPPLRCGGMTISILSDIKNATKYILK